MSNYKKTEKETIQAFSDCNSLSPGPRNLDWRASAPVTLSEAHNIFCQATPDGYNNFQWQFLHDLGVELDHDLLCHPAREGSVCLYISAVEKLTKLQLAGLASIVDADECTQDPHTLEMRLWWD